MNPRRDGALVLALAPAIVLAVAGIALNHFAFIDDGITLLSTRATFRELWGIPDTGRYVPFYTTFHWLLMLVFPPRPWAFSLANGAFLLVATWQVQRLARTLAGTLAGIAAAWLFVLNLSAVENIFTLGKPEPKQLVFWLAVLILLGRALRGVEDRLTRFEPVAMFACALATVFFKETGGLLWVPLALFGGMTWRAWSVLRPVDRRRRVGLLAAACLPLALSAVVVLTHGIRAGSYAREHVMGARGLALVPLPLPGHDGLLASVLVAGLLGGLYLVVKGGNDRPLASMLWLQLVVFVGFFGALRAWLPYYYLAGVAFAAVLLSAALLNPKIPRATVRVVAGVAVIFLIVGGVSRSVAGAAALAGWSGLYDRLTNAVVTERPPRVFFHRSGSWEVHLEARAFWEFLHGLPVMVGVLEADPEPGIPAVTFHDLRSGDWVVEQFGTHGNVNVPFRDFGATRPLGQGLVTPAGATLLPLRLLHAFRADFPLPPEGVAPTWSRRTYLQWQIYEVTAAPRATLEGLEDDAWMRESARLWVRASEPGPLTLRFHPFVHVLPGVTYDNALMIYAGDVLLARCPAAPHGASRCTFTPPRDGARGEPWQRLDLRAARVFSPHELGVSRDTRRLSFNFGPTREGGLAGVFEAPSPR